MKKEKGDLLTIKGNDYTVLDAILFDNKDYVFVNKIVNEEPTENFYVFEVIDNSVLEITEKLLLERLLPIFEKNVQRDIDNIRNSEQYNIDSGE